MSKYNFIYGKDYWVNAGTRNPVHEICYGWDLHKFKNERHGLWFSFNLQDRVNKKTKFAEIGCGLGRIAQWVAPHVKSYTGIDISSTMISGAIEYNKQFGNKNCHFVESTELIEVTGQGKLDLAYSELVFIHLSREEQIKYIEQMFGALKTDGLCCVQIPKLSAYVNGFDPVEVKNILSQFEIVEEQEAPVLYNFLCKKTKRGN